METNSSSRVGRNCSDYCKHKRKETLAVSQDDLQGLTCTRMKGEKDHPRRSTQVSSSGVLEVQKRKEGVPVKDEKEKN